MISLMDPYGAKNRFFIRFSSWKHLFCAAGIGASVRPSVRPFDRRRLLLSPLQRERGRERSERRARKGRERKKELFYSSFVSSFPPSLLSLKHSWMAIALPQWGLSPLPPPRPRRGATAHFHFYYFPFHKSLSKPFP